MAPLAKGAMNQANKFAPTASGNAPSRASPTTARPTPLRARASSPVTARRLKPPQMPSVIPPATIPTPKADCIQANWSAFPPKCSATSSGCSDMAG